MYENDTQIWDEAVVYCMFIVIPWIQIHDSSGFKQSFTLRFCVNKKTTWRMVKADHYNFYYACMHIRFQLEDKKENNKNRYCSEY